MSDMEIKKVCCKILQQTFFQRMRIRLLAPIPSVAVVSPVVSVMESVELDSTSGSGMLVSMVGSIMGTVVSVGMVVGAVVAGAVVEGTVVGIVVGCTGSCA